MDVFIFWSSPRHLFFEFLNCLFYASFPGFMAAFTGEKIVMLTFYPEPELLCCFFSLPSGFSHCTREWNHLCVLQAPLFLVPSSWGGTRASVAAIRGLSYTMTCGILLPGQGLNPHTLNPKADSQSLGPLKVHLLSFFKADRVFTLYPLLPDTVTQRVP